MNQLRRALNRLVSSFRVGRAERELSREISAHLQLLEDEFVAKGMSRDDARYAAKRAFGGVEQAKEQQRDARSFGSLDTWWLDLKLGFRMLVKYPGLTLIGGLSMAMAIAIGAASFAFLYASLHPTLPLDEGERIVGLENVDVSWNNQEDRILHDFAEWRTALSSVQDLGAVQMIQRSLIGPDGRPEDVSVAEMTASGFRVARVPPLMGRTLSGDDERKGAPPVAVIGYDIWRTRFSSDPAIIGRDVRIGAAVHTVVGVMPEGFGFPVNHRVWVPLRADPVDYPRRRGPRLMVFGRLAPGVSIEEAGAELAAAGQRSAAAFPDTHARLRPRIVRYTELWFDDGPKAQMHVVQLLVSMLVIVVGVNVAILVFARTATRQAEILVRAALGASRRRIIGQLFVEALVLSSLSAVAGLGIAQFALAQANAATKLFAAPYGGVPFWMQFHLSWGTVLYTMALAGLAAVMAGVLPALKATGRRMRSQLSQLGGGTSVQLGKMWTALVVAQVAFAVAVLPVAAVMTMQSIQLAKADPGFAADQYVVAPVVIDTDIPPSAEADAYWRELDARYKARFNELIRRVEAEPEVADVTITSREPGTEASRRVEIADGPPRTEAARHMVRYVRVGSDFFEAFGVPTLAGRTFTPADADARQTTRPIIVNRSFAQEVFGGSSPLGRRLRYVDHESAGDDPDTTYEIVGMVGDLPANPITPDKSRQARLYHPMEPGQDRGTQIAVRLRPGAADAFGARLREMTAAVDPKLRLTRVKVLSDVYRESQMGLHWAALALGLITLSVLLLCAAGIYALMSVTVTRRRREIGIRLALGADRGQIVRGIFSRAAMQLTIGVLLGALLAAWLDTLDPDLTGGRGILLLPIVSLFMILVGMLAAVGPARRSLRINPIETLKAE